ncbi:hypothetical protein JCM5353_008479 [Sporobolomyces roseus]
MQSPSSSPTFPPALMPSRSSSTDSTDTIKACKRETEGERDGEEAIHRALSSDEFVRSTHKREKRENNDTKPAFSRSQSDPNRLGQPLSRKENKKVSPSPSLRPLSPTPSMSRSSRIPRRPQSAASNTVNMPRSATAPSLTTSRRPSLTLSTNLLYPASTLPSPAPSPSRLCLATSLPLLSTNEASLQVSSIVVEGELENAKGTHQGEEGSGSGAKEMLEILRDKGTLIHDGSEGTESRDPYTQPFTLPVVERNPRLPSNLFDCTGTISLPDLPPTHPLPEEDEPMSMLPSPISPSASQYHSFSYLPSKPSSRRSRPPSASASRKVSFSLSPSPTPSTPCSPSASSTRLSSILKPGPPAPPTPSELARHLRRADSATLLANSGFGLGKRRQISETVQSREPLEGGSGLGLNTGGERTRSAKKRPPLVSYTSFEDEFGLKPPRPFSADEDGEAGFDHRDQGDRGEEEGAEKKERKWWHLS